MPSNTEQEQARVEEVRYKLLEILNDCKNDNEENGMDFLPYINRIQFLKDKDGKPMLRPVDENGRVIVEAEDDTEQRTN